ncbi:unnamed protein product [Ectocarpus sp. 12 AP-2014]
MFRETTANRASLQRSGGGAGATMKGIDPRLMQTVPLSKQDTKGNSFLRLCNLLSWSTILAATFAVVLDVILLLVVGIEGAEATLHCFGILMALSIILAEREVVLLLRYCAFLESWVLKGFFISFVGTLLLAFEHGGILLDLWRRIGGFILIATGVLYVMLGALCFRQLRSYQLGKIRRKKMMRQELLSLSTQKEQIEKLLADTESKLELL